MNVLPTLEGGLCVLPESDADWSELELISSDAGCPDRLAESLANLMDDDSKWGEYVVPDLKENFNNQCRCVTAAIARARENNEQAVFITHAHAEKWYGTINQARLQLQARYQLDSIENADDLAAEVRDAHCRDRFYLFLQSMLLECVIDSLP